MSRIQLPQPSDDDDEFGPPRASALKIASKKMSENIIANITSTW